MSSTYAHYQGPSSLPSDYAILSRISPNYESSTPDPQLENTAPQMTPRDVTQREGFPVSYYDRPLNPTIGVYPHTEESQRLAPPPTETSPLLDRPPVPCEENIDYDPSPASDNTSTVNMFWEELAVLTKYAIPVFGYAPSFIFSMKASNLFLQHSSSRVFSRRSVCRLYWSYFDHSSCCY